MSNKLNIKSAEGIYYDYLTLGSTPLSKDAKNDIQILENLKNECFEYLKNELGTEKVKRGHFITLIRDFINDRIDEGFEPSRKGHILGLFYTTYEKEFNVVKDKHFNTLNELHDMETARELIDRIEL
ncbi:MAG: hypothetical protein JSW73_01020 [Candidatus Woesearchaeota archaeon]|nr:MAG: hypothetical protein JSW73_01020 [Candidatus Woesearchaeota archaeon]